MKKVERLISKEEYANKIKPLLKEEILIGIKNSESLIPKYYKNILKTWFWMLATFLIILGIGVMIGVFVTYSNQNKAYEVNNYYTTTNNNSQSLNTLQIICLGLGGFIIIVGVAMFIYKGKIIKKIDDIYRSGMNKEAIYKIAIESFPNFKLTKVENTLSPDLYNYKINIPNDGEVVKTSPLFVATYKEKYVLQFQSARYHWVRVVKTKNGTTTRNYYGNSGYILLEGDEKNSDYLYSMNISSFGTALKKIDLENKDFLKTTKYRSNNEIKSRMAFTPLAMEEVSKHHKTITSEFNLVKERLCYAFTAVTDSDRYIINARKGKTDDETAENYLEDIVDDFYKFYEIIGLALIPPML